MIGKRDQTSMRLKQSNNHSTRASQSDLPLAGVRVLELSGSIAASYCAKLFADWGATVTKIEPPGTGDPIRTYGPFVGDKAHPEKSALFIFLNTNKRSVTLDLKQKEAGDLLYQLVDSADVIVEGLPPGTLEEMGIAYGDLHARNPALVLTSITPYGQDGPYAHLPDDELLLWAKSGVLAVTGTPDRPPVKLYGHVAEYQGGVHGAMATLAALLERELSGQGRHLDISIFEALLQLDGGGPRTYFLDKYLYRRSGTRLSFRPEVTHPSGFFATRDGCVAFQTGAQETTECASLMEDQRLADPALTQRPFGDEEAIATVDRLLQSWFGRQGKREACEMAQAWRFPCSPVLSVDEVLVDAHLAERRIWGHTVHPVAGEVQLPTRSFTMELSWPVMKAAPLLGQHTEMVLGQELGVSPARCRAFRRREII